MGDMQEAVAIGVWEGHEKLFLLRGRLIGRVFCEHFQLAERILGAMPIDLRNRVALLDVGLTEIFFKKFLILKNLIIIIKFC